MADLNQSQPKLLNYLIQNAIWWIKFAGIDGFRVDTFPYNNPKPMIKWLEAIRLGIQNLILLVKDGCITVFTFHIGRKTVNCSNTD